MIQKTNKTIPRRNKYILENILLNIFKFCILKYIIKFQSHDNNKKKIRLLQFRETPVKNQWHKFFRDIALLNQAFCSVKTRTKM